MVEETSDSALAHPAVPDGAPTRWAQATGGVAGEDYARRMAEHQERVAAQGGDVHGEARFVHELVAPGARILDAGCGTGRVAIALADLGHPVLGIDADLSMLRVAADAAPKIPFWLSDLAELDVPQAAIGAGFDAVVLAGNVVPYLAEGTLPAVLLELARVTKPGGYVVAGFGIHATQLPEGLPVTTLAEYDAAAAAAGFAPAERYAGWSREEATPDSPYAVSVHRLVTPPPPPGTAHDGLPRVTGAGADAGILPAGRVPAPAERTAAHEVTRVDARPGGVRGLFRRR